MALVKRRKVDLGDRRRAQKFNRDQDLETTDQPHERHLKELQKYFLHQTFRPHQWEIITTLIHAKRDVIAIMARGKGKSLCFQFPAVYLEAVTIVISPHVNRIDNQILNLKLQEIPACFLRITESTNISYQDIYDNKYRIVYMNLKFCFGDQADEVLTTIRERLNVALIAIDEVHAISSWDLNLKNQYNQLNIIRNRYFPNVPIMAMTATATPREWDEIIMTLNLKEPRVFCSGFDRPNLYFAVKERNSCTIIGDLRDSGCLTPDGRPAGATLIYCISSGIAERECDDLCRSGLKAVPYHSKVSLRKRKECLAKFRNNLADIMVLTPDFGIGIDRPDIRNVIHCGCSSSVESYYQEVERAGRDGLPSNCVTFYEPYDIQLMKLIFKKTGEAALSSRNALLEILIKYLSANSCRREFLLQYFNGKIPDHGDISPRRDELFPDCCDNCNEGRIRDLVPPQVSFTPMLLIGSAADANAGREPLSAVIYGLLLKERKALAIIYQCKRSSLISAYALKRVSIEKPTTLDGLTNIIGFTQPRIDKLGMDFIKIVKECCGSSE